MCRHIIRPFKRMAQTGQIFGSQTVKEKLKIMQHIGVGIFIDTNTGRGVLNKEMQ